VKAPRWGRALAAAIAAAAALVVAAVVWLNLRGDDFGAGEDSPQATTTLTPAQAVERIERGAYLARAGNRAACHTVRGGPPYAGGRAIATPFGTVFSSNLTPDPATGIGGWSARDFARALHNGRSRDGRLLVPAFPYTSYTQVTREDADAIFAFLRSLPAVAQPNRPHALRFPYDRQVALAVWRALYFRPGVYAAQPERSAAWNRGAYLVRGLGHCAACHAARNVLGATEGELDLGGGAIPAQHWVAPSLSSAAEAGVAAWPLAEVVRLLRTGNSAQGAVLGPMAEVVFGSTQHLNDEDLQAIAVYLQALPQSTWPTAAAKAPEPASMSRGAAIYKDRCAACHGPQGEGAAGAYPPLAGSRMLTMANATNTVRVIVDGGFPPTTPGNPRPYGMPPFGHVLADAQIADVATYVRNAFGNRAAPVSELDVLRAR
jgi:mono/diheme cytochrome c family protein